jgi:hypothetical protein
MVLGGALLHPADRAAARNSIGSEAHPGCHQSPSSSMCSPPIAAQLRGRQWSCQFLDRRQPLRAPRVQRRRGVTDRRKE